MAHSSPGGRQASFAERWPSPRNSRSYSSAEILAAGPLGRGRPCHGGTGEPRRGREWSKGGDALPREPPRNRGRPIRESRLPAKVGLCVYGVRGGRKVDRGRRTCGTVIRRSPSACCIRGRNRNGAGRLAFRDDRYVGTLYIV